MSAGDAGAFGRDGALGADPLLGAEPGGQFAEPDGVGGDPAPAEPQQPQARRHGDEDERLQRFETELGFGGQVQRHPKGGGRDRDGGEQRDHGEARRGRGVAGDAVAGERWREIVDVQGPVGQMPRHVRGADHRENGPGTGPGEQQGKRLPQQEHEDQRRPDAVLGKRFAEPDQKDEHGGHRRQQDVPGPIAGTRAAVRQARPTGDACLPRRVPDPRRVVARLATGAIPSGPAHRKVRGHGTTA
jgi:hypothetical protein